MFHHILCLVFLCSKIQDHSLYAGLRLQGGVCEGEVADLLRNALCFSSAKQRTDSEQTSKEDEGGVGLKSRSFEYSEIRWNM
jgi:hypothetical protein